MIPVCNAPHSSLHRQARYPSARRSSDLISTTHHKSFLFQLFGLSPHLEYPLDHHRIGRWFRKTCEIKIDAHKKEVTFIGTIISVWKQKPIMKIAARLFIAAAAVTASSSVVSAFAIGHDAHHASTAATFRHSPTALFMVSVAPTSTKIESVRPQKLLSSRNEMKFLRSVSFNFLPFFHFLFSICP